MRQHHAADERRFIQVEHPEAGYGRYLVSLLEEPDSLVLVAEEDERVVGYVYADIESTSWKDLRGPCGYIHDVYVEESQRTRGAGRKLMQGALDWMRSKGHMQAVLLTKTKNENAQRLFASLGFRPTMVEMTLDQAAGPADAPGAGERRP